MIKRKGFTETNILFGLIIFVVVLFAIQIQAKDYLTGNQFSGGGFNTSSDFVPPSGSNPVSTASFMKALFSLSSPIGLINSTVVLSVSVISIYIIARLIRGGG